MIERRTNEYLYPSKKDYYSYFVYSKGKVIANGTKDEVLEATGSKNIEDLKDKYVVEEFFEKDKYNIHRKLWSDEEISIEEEWKKALYKACGVKNDTINDLIYSKAYEDGHAYGHEEVENHFAGLSYFVTEILSCINEKE